MPLYSGENIDEFIYQSIDHGFLRTAFKWKLLMGKLPHSNVEIPSSAI